MDTVTLTHTVTGHTVDVPASSVPTHERAGWTKKPAAQPKKRPGPVPALPPDADTPRAPRTTKTPDGPGPESET